MPSVELEDAPLVDWTGEAFRLIPSRFPPVNLYAGLVADDRLDELVAVEDLTNPRLRSHKRIAAVSEGDAAADPRLQNWNLAPFAYGNPDGSLFFGEDRPCLEVAAERQTALAVSVAKREAFLASTQETAIGLDMRMLCTPVTGRFWDLRDIEEPVSKLDVKARRAVGAKMPSTAHGLLFRPAERLAGTGIVIVSGDALKRTTQTVHFRYVWDGTRISVLYAFDKEGTEIAASELGRTEDILAAA